jgi:hypothetical protein
MFHFNDNYFIRLSIAKNVIMPAPKGGQGLTSTGSYRRISGIRQRISGNDRP